MKKAILTAPGELPFAGILAEEVLARGLEALKVLGSTPDSADAVLGEAAKRNGIAEARYNPGSSISARTVFIEAANSFEAIEAAIFIHSPAEASMARLADFGPAEIESFVDRTVKGNLLLVREAAAYFARRGRGSLVFVLLEPKGESRAVLESLALSLFKSIAQSSFDASADLLPAFGFHCQSESDRAFARFILKTLEESPRKTAGRWIKYAGKGGIFGIF